MPDYPDKRITPSKPLEPAETPVSPGQAPRGFESYMQGTPSSSQQPPLQGTPTPMELAKQPPIAAAGDVSFASLGAQAKNAQDALGLIGQQLKTKNLQLKRSQSHLIRQKLSDAGRYIRSAGSKIGLNLQEPTLPPDMVGLARFISMVNSGQDQLVQVQKQLDKMAAQGANVNPAEMLSVQVKMGLAEQELNYTSLLLGKVIQSFTQILNTQL